MAGWRELLRVSSATSRLAPGSMTLATLLAGINTLLVALVIGGISWIAVDLLRDLADEQGLSQVKVAASSAREDLREIAEEALLEARTIAERPTLQRLWREQRLEERFLGDFPQVLAGRRRGHLNLGKSLLVCEVAK
jgi:hypothetical protein